MAVPCDNCAPPVDCPDEKENLYTYNLTANPTVAIRAETITAPCVGCGADISCLDEGGNQYTYSLTADPILPYFFIGQLPTAGQIALLCCGHLLTARTTSLMTAAQIAAIVAALQAQCQQFKEECSNPPLPPGPGPASVTTMFFNTFQLCSGKCWDGSLYSFSVPAGMFVSTSQAQANSDAHSYACHIANLNHHCPPFNSVCPNVALPSGFDVYTVNGVVFGPADFTFSIIAGALPAGVTLSKTSATTAELIGTPTVLGNYSWTVRAQSGFFTIDYKSSMGVLGITNLPLPNAAVGTPYSYQLTFTGNVHTVTVAVDVDPLNPPFWMTVSASGLITGTPAISDAGNTFNLDFVLTDA